MSIFDLQSLCPNNRLLIGSPLGPRCPPAMGSWVALQYQELFYKKDGLPPLQHALNPIGQSISYSHNVCITVVPIGSLLRPIITVSHRVRAAKIVDDSSVSAPSLAPSGAMKASQQGRSIHVCTSLFSPSPMTKDCGDVKQ